MRNPIFGPISFDPNRIHWFMELPVVIFKVAVSPLVRRFII